MMKSIFPNRRLLSLLALTVCLLGVSFAFADGPDPADRSGGILGTVTDVDGRILSGATVEVDGVSPSDRRTALSDDNGFFSFRELRAETPYRVVVSAEGFESWSSDTITLNTGQLMLLSGVTLKLKGTQTSITVTETSEEIATEQVHMEEQQRVFGIIPNFYVVYDHDAAPLTPKLKFRLAYKVSTDAVTAAGIGFMAGVYQASDHLNFQQGMKGYGQRFGTIAADGLTDIMIGGAVLPSLLHQDPRYFYQGTGSTGSRLRHALANPFFCRGDNGRTQVNYSTIGGDVISAAISMSYLPQSNRSASTFLGNIALGTMERLMSSIAQEFILGRFTHKAPDPH
jgi:hypothetical protein